jgi:hypothetical protein
MDPLVFAIFPCDNAEPRIEAASASARPQTWRRCEIVRIDDVSTDRSGEIADRKSGPDMQIVHEDNMGVSAAGPWNESLTPINDHEYNTRRVLSSGGVAFCASAQMPNWSGIEGSMSRRIGQSSWESASRATKLSVSLLLARENSHRVRGACAPYYQRLVHSAYPHVQKRVKIAEKRMAGLGRSGVRAKGGAFLGMSRLFGWKSATRAQALGLRLMKGALT